MKNTQNTQKAHSRSGFTATEALVGVSILSVLVLALIAYSGGFIKTGNKNLTGSIIGTFGAFEDESDIDEVAKTIVSDLGSVQAKSKTGVENLVWGVCFRSEKKDEKDKSGSYDIVSNIAPSGNACDEADGEVNEVRLTVELPKDIKLTDPADGAVRYVVFKKTTGETTSAANHRSFKISSSDESRIITVTNDGIITYSNGGPVNPTTTTTVFTTTTSPSAPQSLAAATGNSQIALAWNAPKVSGSSSIVEYKIYRGTDPNGLIRPIVSVSAPNTVYIDKDVLVGVTYYYRVSAKNQSFESAASNEASATPSGAVVSQPVPTITVNASTPSSPRALDADGGRSEIVLTWSTPVSAGTSSITEYVIFRRTSSGDESQIGTASGNSTIYTDDGLGSNKTYFYRVAARNSAGVGDKSNQASATTRSSGGGGGGGSNNNNNSSVPSAARNLSAVAGNNQVYLSWLVPTSVGYGTLRYEIYRSVNNNSNYSNVTSTTSTAFVDSNRTNGTTYFYKVVAATGAGNGPDSNEESATPTSGGSTGGGTTTPPPSNSSYPSAPQNLRISGTTSSSISIEWFAPSSNGGSTITKYKINRSASTDGAAPVLGYTTGTNYYDNGLASGAYFCYNVSAINSNGPGAYAQVCGYSN